MFEDNSIDKIVHDLESGVSQIEFAFHHNPKTKEDEKEVERIFKNAIQRIRELKANIKNLNQTEIKK